MAFDFDVCHGAFQRQRSPVSRQASPKPAEKGSAFKPAAKRHRGNKRNLRASRSTSHTFVHDQGCDQEGLPRCPRDSYVREQLQVSNVRISWSVSTRSQSCWHLASARCCNCRRGRNLVLHPSRAQAHLPCGVAGVHVCAHIPPARPWTQRPLLRIRIAELNQHAMVRSCVLLYNSHWPTPCGVHSTPPYLPFTKPRMSSCRSNWWPRLCVLRAE
jgi:hypothetical protein